MEHSVGTVINTVGGEKKDEEENKDEKIRDTGPVVYQLVRVEGDGRLVPATDDEVMEVEKLLEDEKSELAIRHDEGCFSNEPIPKKSDLEGLVQAENADGLRKLNARLENIKVILQEVKQEERLWLSGKSFSSSPKCMATEDQTSKRFNNSNTCTDKLQPENTSSKGVPCSLEPDIVQIVEAGTVETCSRAQTEAAASRSSISKSWSSLPDFPILRGEICLDKFSIRELQEAFRATFGRHTSVKDKLWLKRRIAMGLTNSCHVPDTNFIIKDNKILDNETKEEPMEICQSKTESEPLSLDIHVINVSHQNLETSLNSQIADEKVSGKRPRTSPSADDGKEENSQMEQCVVKRMRKPTKRYIEELSEFETRESTAKPSSCVKNSGQCHYPAKVPTRTVCDGDANSRIFSTRYVSVGGGFGFHVPSKYRARRGQPRKNLMVLMKYLPKPPSLMVGTSVVLPVPTEDGENGSRSGEIRSVPVQILQPSFVGAVGTERDRDTMNCESDLALEHGRLYAHGDTPIKNTASTRPERKAVERRMHHRAWTLCEVRKLVDGVAKYGAGRWSEIRRLAFASYSYRTSVDLKDKWRNLLRASLAQCPTGKKAKKLRKHASIRIPTPILSQVRELAKLHAPTGIKVSPRKSADHGNGAAHGEGSGFL